MMVFLGIKFWLLTQSWSTTLEQIDLESQNFTYATHFMCLGVTTENMLSWKLHTQNIIKLFYIFKTIRKCLSIRHIKMMYYAFVQIILQYGITTWSSVYWILFKNWEIPNHTKICSKNPMTIDPIICGVSVPI